MNSKEIRTKLRNGTTITQICTEYQLTFKDLITLMSKYGNENTFKNTPRKSTGYLYITEHCNRYIIRKNRKHFGTYRSIGDAVRVRDWFIRNGWYQRRLDRACRECGVSRCRR